MSVLKVAAAQMPCATGLTDDSIAQHLGVIDDARSKGVDVLVFPELSLTGYAGTPDVLEVARSARGPELALLAAAVSSRKGRRRRSTRHRRWSAGARFSMSTARSTLPGMAALRSPSISRADKASARPASRNNGRWQS